MLACMYIIITLQCSKLSFAFSRFMAELHRMIILLDFWLHLKLHGKWVLIIINSVKYDLRCYICMLYHDWIFTNKYILSWMFTNKYTLSWMFTNKYTLSWLCLIYWSVWCNHLVLMFTNICRSVCCCEIIKCNHIFELQWIYFWLSCTTCIDCLIFVLFISFFCTNFSFSEITVCCCQYITVSGNFLHTNLFIPWIIKFKMHNIGKIITSMEALYYCLNCSYITILNIFCLKKSCYSISYVWMSLKINF